MLRDNLFMRLFYFERLVGQRMKLKIKGSWKEKGERNRLRRERRNLLPRGIFPPGSFLRRLIFVADDVSYHQQRVGHKRNYSGNKVC